MKTSRTPSPASCAARRILCAFCAVLTAVCAWSHAAAAGRSDDIFGEGGFFTGCNYWAKNAGMYMWSRWDRGVVEKELAALAANGVTVMRVFPLWSDFQPLTGDCAAGGKYRSFRFRDNRDLPNHDGVDPVMMARFRELCDVAEKNGIRLVVGIVTGWMSGRQFVPPVFEDRNVLSDPEAVMWQTKFVKRFVREMKDHPAIAAWDFGNECNCMGAMGEGDQAMFYNWMDHIGMAIRSEDATRPVVSGMHGLSTDDRASQPIRLNAELSDVLCTHPYQFYVPDCGKEAFNTMRTELHPTAESLLYRDIGGKPCFVEEIGNLGTSCTSDERTAAGMRATMFSAWANDLKGCLWWCNSDQEILEFPPYTLTPCERELGMLRQDLSPKPVMLEMKAFQDFRKSLPFGKLPKAKTDAVIVVPEKENGWAPAFGAYLLARQAGFNPSFAGAERDLPESGFYIVCSTATDGGYTYPAQKRIYGKAENGATVLLVYSGETRFTHLKEHAGVKVDYCTLSPCERTFALDAHPGRKMSVWDKSTCRLLDGGAEVLARTAEGEPVFTRFKCGKGQILVCNAPIDRQTVGRTDVLAGENIQPYHLVFREAAKIAGVKNTVEKGVCPQIGITEHPAADGKTVVVAINFEPREIVCPVKIDGTVATVWRGDVKDGEIRLSPNEAALFEVEPRGWKPLAVDAEIPAGNIIVERVDGDTVKLRQDLRDTSGDWFYWAFRVKGAAGRTLAFRFTRGVAVGTRGAAVSVDKGKTWIWSDDFMDDPRDPATGDHASWSEFKWKFAPDADEVWFSQTIPYTQNDWESFVSRHSADYGRSFATNTLCLSRKGRSVETGRFGRIDGKAKHRLVLTSRHHCGETTATFVLEGLLESVFADDDLGRWMRENIEIRAVPFVDKDGVADGDQGKNRRPHDHCRDYNDAKPSIYPEVAAIRAMAESWKKDGGEEPAVVDIHCPWLRGSWFEKDNSNEYIYTVGMKEVDDVQRRFASVLERVQRGGLGFRASDHYGFGRGWNTGDNFTQGSTLTQWAVRNIPGSPLAVTFEVPFANTRRITLTPSRFRAFGRDIAAALREFLDGAASAGPECIDGIYPHLAMFNDEGECGTGAVVPWAGDLWAITYGPHCPVGSSDKLYRIKPDLTREVFPGSVGGTPANRMIHRETEQLLIGPYVIDAKGNVRIVPPAKMPGRLTGAARHLTAPADKVYVATMETGLYELDMRTLAVNTLIRENGKNDREIGAMLGRTGMDWPAGWNAAPRTHVPGYHAKGLASGFGRVFVSNNGEDSEDARRNPFVPSGVLAWWNEPGRDWTPIRRCQFTEVTTPDGIYGNEHPWKNPVWAMGWDAKSVILGVTTNGSEWAYYRLPKASHAYDGAHGWNTEWPRIRDVGFGDGTLLATMHGTFWRFPKDFSPMSPNGIRPISTYLKVIGDFCRWKDAPGGDAIVFGCDDQAKNEFLGKRGLKKDAPRCERSQSNLWFVKQEELGSFGPPSGEGFVWLNEDVKAGDVSDPFLHAGYETMDFEFTRADGSPVGHELLEDGDWVRVKCLEDAAGATARFAYGPARCAIPPLDGRKPYVDVTDDDGRTWRFPNVNGDTNVVCREIATERDLLYVGGVWYEVPAENAGGFASLRPIALADAPVESLRGERGLMYLNGSPMAIDALWKNGTAPAAYWLWRTHGFAH